MKMLRLSARFGVLLGAFALSGCLSLKPVPTVDDVDLPDVQSEAALIETDAPDTGAIRRGLSSMFRGNRAQTVDRNVELVDQGVFLEYGDVAAVCGLSNRDLGQKVETKSGYTLYDAGGDPASPRTHYLTGFADGCARQFTAAMVIFADVGTHEFVRYQSATANDDYTETDKAYEVIKARFCRAGHGDPCGAKLDALAGRTTFLTLYERFGTNPHWINILLSDGVVSAVDAHDH
ncbi:hypothetical protein BVC71_01895 [Marivivens niveibacter]|uniref:Lipoprotein n=1 Tax=Marivivens niveibacter TaxID=1930667 RepID=A0A251X1M2_9RHOB|nr:hypothetical protein [Marivivens niveibacter]OUD10288.1 hypothetical protein BVC71_01895 [Marivivens niveibacter]